jgi:hypothetical protein
MTTYRSFDHTFVAGDREVITETIGDSLPSGGVNLTGRSVRIAVRSQTTGDKIVDEAAEVVDAAAGTVRYEFAPEKTMQAGRYEYEWVVEDGSEDPTTLPRGSSPTIRIRDDVEGSDEVVSPIPDDQRVGTLIADGLTGSIVDDERVTDLSGTNLAVDENGALVATDTDTQLTTEEVQDIVGAFVAATGAASVSYDDANGTLTFTATDTDTQLTTEEVQDKAAAYLAGGTNAQVAYDDANNALTINADHDHSGDTLGTASSPVTTAHVETTNTKELLVNELPHKGTLIQVEHHEKGAQYFDPANYATGAEAIRQALDWADATARGYGEIRVTPPLWFEIEVNSTLDLDLGRWGAVVWDGPTGAAEKESTDNFEHSRFKSNITDGAAVVTHGDHAPGQDIKGISVIGTGSDGTLLTLGSGDETEYSHLGARDGGGDGIRIGQQPGEGEAHSMMMESNGGHNLFVDAANFHAYSFESEKAGKSGVVLGGQNAKVSDYDCTKAAGAAVNLIAKGGSARDGIAGDCNIGIRINDDHCSAVHSNITSSGKYSLDIVKNNTLIKCDHLQMDPDDTATAHIHIGTGNHRVSITNVELRNTANVPAFQVASDATDIHIAIPSFNGEQAVVPPSATYTASFDTAFTHIPRLDVQAEGATYQGYANPTTDANGNYTGLEFSFDTTPTQLDWEAIPRNVGV